MARAVPLAWLVNMAHPVHGPGGAAGGLLLFFETGFWNAFRRSRYGGIPQ